MPAFSPRGYKNPSTEAEALDPAFWVTVGLNQDARWLELLDIIKATVTEAVTGALEEIASTSSAFVQGLGWVVMGPEIPPQVPVGAQVFWVQFDQDGNFVDIWVGTVEPEPAPVGAISALPGQLNQLSGTLATL